MQVIVVVGLILFGHWLLFTVRMPWHMATMVLIWSWVWFVMPAFTPCDYASHSYGGVFPLLFRKQINEHYMEIRPYSDGFSLFAAVFIQLVLLATIWIGYAAIGVVSQIDFERITGWIFK